MRKRKKSHRPGRAIWVDAVRDMQHEKREERRRAKLAPVRLPELTILTKPQREGAVRRILPVLRSWTWSPFEYEATCRTAIRADLCLGGHGWKASDAEAAAIVEGGLAEMGAARPSWDEGQWTYAISPDCCAWCGRLMDDDEGRSGARYCSAECAKSAMERRDFSDRSNRNRAYSQVVRAVQIYSMPQKPCAECGKLFHPRKDQTDRAYCSRKCLGAARTRGFERVGSCYVCGNPFIAHHPAAKTCSDACHQTAVKIRNGTWEPQKFTRIAFEMFVAGNPAFELKPNARTGRVKRPSRAREAAVAAKGGKPTPLHLVTCEVCRNAFWARMPTARICGDPCWQAKIRLAKGAWTPRKLSLPVFELFVVGPAQAVAA